MLEQTKSDATVDESLSSEPIYDEKIKIMVIGEVRVGKTSLALFNWYNQNI